MMVGVIGFSNSLTGIGSLVYSIAAITMGVMLYFVLSMLLVDLLNIFVKLKPIYFGISVLVVLVPVVAYGLWNATNNKLLKIEVQVEDLKEELKVMHFSDIHLGHFRGKDYLQRLVDKAKSQDTDFVVITGDLFDGKIQLKLETLEPLKDFAVPVYFVEGNHDKYSGVHQIKDYLRKTDVHVLENEIDTFKGIQLVGLNHMQADNDTPSVPPNPSDISIKSVLSELIIDKDHPSILLHHSPDGIEHANLAGIDLYLCGHTHAGQLFPVNYINDLLFKYNKGLHKYKDTRIYVSQGAGTFGPPMRLGTKSEITLINLVPVN